MSCFPCANAAHYEALWFQAKCAVYSLYIYWHYPIIKMAPNKCKNDNTKYYSTKWRQSWWASTPCIIIDTTLSASTMIKSSNYGRNDKQLINIWLFSSLITVSHISEAAPRTFPNSFSPYYFSTLFNSLNHTFFLLPLLLPFIT